MIATLQNSNNNNNIDLLYDLCKQNQVEKVKTLVPLLFTDNIEIINKINTSTGSTCLHVACYYGHREIVQILLDYGAVHSIRNLHHNLTPYEEAYTENIKQLFLKQRKLFSSDYDYIEWSMVGNDLIDKRKEFRQAIDLYKTYDNHHHLVSKLIAEFIQYYLNEYLKNNDDQEDQISFEQIQIIEHFFKQAIEEQDYLTYFIKAYTLTVNFYKILNKYLALYILQYFDKTKDFCSNY
ncbi:unnamed protein product, partial [Didymodactylos carnosus]